MDEKEELLDAIRSVFGFVPPGTRMVLRCLTHRHVVGFAQAYLHKYGRCGRCANYPPGWSCAQESASNAELYVDPVMGLPFNADISLDERWCENCHYRILRFFEEFAH